MTATYVINALRTPVAPRDGALRAYQSTELAASVIQTLVGSTPLCGHAIDYVVMGNALYAGGNPARVAALAAGLDESVPAITLDTQCCAGLDAIAVGSALIRANLARAVIAGGMESYSRAPIRQHRSLDSCLQPQSYARPPFTPWPERDPDMLESAAQLASQRNIRRATQEAYAIESHRKALSNPASLHEVLPIEGVYEDTFTRRLSEPLCERVPLLCGEPSTGLTSATVAVEADAAACVVLVGEAVFDALSPPHARSVRITDTCSLGGDPCQPALAPIAAINTLLHRQDIGAWDLANIELMEAFAVQAMACIDECHLDSRVVNRAGGALARGHPIGASGAILAVRLWHELQRQPLNSYGMAAIAAAGGLASATLWEVL